MESNEQPHTLENKGLFFKLVALSAILKEISSYHLGLSNFIKISENCIHNCHFVSYWEEN